MFFNEEAQFALLQQLCFLFGCISLVVVVACLCHSLFEPEHKLRILVSSGRRVEQKTLCARLPHDMHLCIVGLSASLQMLQISVMAME